MSRGGSSTLWSRRALAGAALLLGGCGFRPLYGPGGGPGDPAVSAELAAVRVALLPDRFGQLLRRELQQRLTRGAAEAQPRYELRLQPNLTTEGIGYQPDGVYTRVRYIATANWTLLRLGTPPDTLARGSERATEAYNYQNNQFFAAEISRDATERRIAMMLAEEVVIRVALDFRQRQGTA